MMAEDSVTILLNDSMSTETADSNTGPYFRPLAANKTFHVFISYSSKDEEFVDELRNHLEVELNFKCMFDKKDFTPGKHVIENMAGSFDICEKALFVVSKNFMKSGFCDTEMNIAFSYAMEKNLRNFTIFLKIDDIQLARKQLIYSYIDGTDRNINAIGNKFKEAFSSPDIVAAVENYKNGKTVLNKFPVELSPNLFGGMKYVFPDLSESDMEQLRLSNLEDSATCYKVIQKEIDKTRLFNNYALVVEPRTRKGISVKCGIIVGCLTFIFSILAFMYWGFGYPNSLLYWISGSLTAILLWICVSFRIIVQWEATIFRAVRAGLRPILFTRMNLKGSKCIILCRIKDGIWGPAGLYLAFIYYDIAACLEFFKEHVEWSDTSEEYINDKCEGLFKEAIMHHYGECYWKVPNTDNPRHTAVNSHRCLCQLLEDERKKLNTSEKTKTQDSQIEEVV